MTRLIVVTGVSGSGRLSALRILEDLGFYCVDNLPVALAPSVLRLATSHDPRLKGIALGVDARERLFFPEWPRVFTELDHDGYTPEVLFLDCSDEVLARRYSETRRPHPLAERGATIIEGIREERLALAEMRERASRVIDTSNLSVHELREVLTAWILGSASDDRMSVALVSFGYKYGMPVGLDVVFDVRFLPNPFFIADLRPLDGLDSVVRDYVVSSTEAQTFLDQVSRLLEFLIPLYHREGKSYLTIGFGCTGGRHRSPAIVVELSERLREHGIEIQTRHHHITR